MWRCRKCLEDVEDSFEVCWNCGTGIDGREDPSFPTRDESPSDKALARKANRPGLMCVRCSEKLEFMGTKHFHEGTRFWDSMGGIWELFKHREHLDAYCCPHCGKVEFFVDGIGEAYRQD